MQVIAFDLPDELYGVKLAILVAAGEIHLAEPSNRKAVINLISERILGCPVYERIKKLGLLEFSLVQTQSVVEVEIPIDGLEPHYAPHHAFYFLHREFTTDQMRV